MIPGYLGSDPVRQMWTFRVIKAMPAWWKGTLIILIGVLLNIYLFVCGAAIFGYMFAGYYVGTKYPHRTSRAAQKGLQTGIAGSVLVMLFFIAVIGGNFIHEFQKAPLFIPGIIISLFVPGILVSFISSIWSSKREAKLHNDL
jgi:hypothetical protein